MRFSVLAAFILPLAALAAPPPAQPSSSPSLEQQKELDQARADAVQGFNATDEALTATLSLADQDPPLPAVVNQTLTVGLSFQKSSFAVKKVLDSIFKQNAPVNSSVYVGTAACTTRSR
jgi:hypothetical protein